MKLRAAPRLIIAAAFITAGFLLPLPDPGLPAVPPFSDGRETANEISASPETAPAATGQRVTPENLSRLFEVRQHPAAGGKPKPPPEQPLEAPPEPEPPLPASPPLPPLRYVGEAVIRGRPVFFVMAGRPERLVRLTEESNGEYRLISTAEDELILEYRGAKLRLSRP